MQCCDHPRGTIFSSFHTSSRDPHIIFQTVTVGSYIISCHRPLSVPPRSVRSAGRFCAFTLARLRTSLLHQTASPLRQTFKMTDVKQQPHVDTANDSDTPPPTKENIDFVESGSASSQEIGWDEKSTKKLVRKMDWALLPFLALLYLLSFLDRSMFKSESQKRREFF